MCDLIGYKGMNLSALTTTGHPVLSGFYILPEAYREFLQSNKLEQKIAAIITISDLSIPDQLRTCGARIRQLIMEHDIPDSIKAAILPAYWRLFTLPASGKLYVEVTPSVIIEDQPQSSFNGQPDHFDSIFGESALLCAIKKMLGIIVVRSGHRISSRTSYQACKNLDGGAGPAHDSLRNFQNADEYAFLHTQSC